MGLRSLRSRGADLFGPAATVGLALALAASGCATGGAGNALESGSGTGGGSSRGSDASAGGPGAPTGDDQGTSGGGDGAASGDDVSATGDDAAGDDAAGDDAAGDDSAVSACAATCTSGCCDSAGMCQAGTDDGVCGAGGATCADCTTAGGTCQAGSCSAAPTPTYVCTTTLPAPSPVCDSKHKYCLCTSNAQCNSNGLNVVNNGGCNSQHCSGSGTCTGGQVVDSAGCSVVGPTCNLGGNQGCPAKTTCEVNHGGCGGAVQCCWCTSDAACPVGGKCVNDSTQNQCKGQGPCTGSGTDYDGMHCQLASPGIPLCAAQ
jgi:hypothetical protein